MVKPDRLQSVTDAGDRLSEIVTIAVAAHPPKCKCYRCAALDRWLVARAELLPVLEPYPSKSARREG